MDNRPLLFIDSGLGSFPYGNFFHSRNRGEKLICIGDRANFPYGIKSREAVIAILDALTGKYVSMYDPKLLALVCNTASVTSLDFLRQKYPALPIVGTVPAIKPAVLTSKTRRIGVIATARTVEDPYNRELVSRYGPGCEIVGIAATELVDFVQLHYGSSTPADRLNVVRPYVERFRAAGADAVVLACTHFLLLEKEFRAAAGEDIRVYDSMEGVSRRIESILDKDGGRLRAGTNSGESAPLVVVTGEDKLEPYWEQLSLRFGFTLEQNR